MTVGPVGLGGTDQFLGALVDGVGLGAVYALLAVGFVIIFRATQVINFAHGSLAAAGAFLAASFATVLDFPGRFMPDAPVWLEWTLAAACAVLATAFLGLVAERLLIRPVIGQPLLVVAVITVGADVVIRTITDDFIGRGVRPIGDPWGSAVTDVLGVPVHTSQLATVAVALVCFALVGWFFASRMGMAVRATASDREAALAQGIDVGRVFAIAWAIGAVLAAVAGIFSSMTPREAGVSDTTDFLLFRAFPAVLIGGLDSVVGAVVGGFLVGISEIVVGTYTAGLSGVLGEGFGGIVPYLLMLAVLIVRPRGLFGNREVPRV